MILNLRLVYWTEHIYMRANPIKALMGVWKSAGDDLLINTIYQEQR